MKTGIWILSLVMGIGLLLAISCASGSGKIPAGNGGSGGDDTSAVTGGSGVAGAGGSTSSDSVSAGSGGSSTSPPTSLCGNGQVDEGEQCDCGNDGLCSTQELDYTTCSSLQEGVGMLGCDTQCQFNISMCSTPTGSDAGPYGGDN